MNVRGPLPGARALVAIASVGVALVSAPSRVVNAQSSLLLESRSNVERGGDAACAMAMSSDVRLRNDHVQATVLAAPMVGIAPWRASSPAMSVDAQSPNGYRWRVRASGAVGPSSPACATPSQWSRGWLQIARRIPRGGVALAWGSKSLSALDPSRDREGIAASLWQERGPNRWLIDVHSRRLRWTEMSKFSHVIQRPDSSRSDSSANGWNRFTRPFTVYDSAQSQRGAETLELRTSWQRVVGRTSLQLTAGGMTGLFARQGGLATDSLSASVTSQRVLRTQFWLRADADLRLTSAATLLMSAAALPSTTFTRVGGRGMASIGLALRSPALRRSKSGARADASATAEGVLEVLAPARPPLTDAHVTGSDSVTVRLRLRNSGARRIEISGEPLHWRPAAMTRIDADWWELSLTTTPGTYRVSVRIDDAKWGAPLGWPTISDEFGGEVALITVR